MVTVDIDADAERAIGLDRQLERGLAASARSTPGDPDQTGLSQFAGDVGDRRGGQARLPRDVDARRFRAKADRLQDGAQIIVTGACQVRPRQRKRQSRIASVGATDRIGGARLSEQTLRNAS
ncbi:hypothetical protein [Sphingomonas sp. Leaf21]|uniref:hypothetical protein n=1 Tax=Sphingomonas sp. Leaf21 TaxID=2876550 RepID=UPI002E79F756|nr:hypothetical protein [Sphingomonas sp. Leaf21]